MAAAVGDLPSTWLVPHVLETFPEHHVIDTTDGKHVTLERTVHVTDDDFGARQLSRQKLEQLLALVDANLGALYAAFAGDIYTKLTSSSGRPCSAAQWHPLKRGEMSTPGLVYVMYHDASDASGVPLAFASLLLTHEPELEMDARVVYLYELHVSETIQNCGLGTWIMRDCVSGLLRRLGVWVPGFRGLELTVFRANTQALRLYRDRLGMRPVPWSACVADQSTVSATDAQPTIRRTRSRTYRYALPNAGHNSARRRARQPEVLPAFCILFWDGCS
ncbi:LAME_0G15346g1_1 [Lachancea meyersii CBS 8951]|uniref:N-alpha-acetyltransferase 40 n=1 Tax=Lachancea meyersii CBS 8951 TaxID=1266667 RepID=A0A1G4KAP6_9SACH|nr:LAME_0G15346g1_1 [Lachancea meyersii CBS 8951]